jgi:galactitol-specific phosphotransferase system IIC component
MAWWAWLDVGIGGALCFSVLVGFVIGRILGVIAGEVSELADEAEWASAASMELTQGLNAPLG